MEQAFTDRDVREMPSLKEVAEKYVLEYKGSFQPLLDCKSRMAKGLELEVAHIRLVLNTMRADPRVELLPKVEWKDNVVPFIPRQRRSTEDNYYSSCYKCQMGDPHRVHETSEEYYGITKASGRRPYFDLKTRVNYPYAISMHKRSEVIHEIDVERSSFRFFTSSKEFQLDLRYFCRSEYLRRIRVRFLTQWEADQLEQRGLMRYCPTCSAVKLRRLVTSNV